jgi:hypothetical protein
MLLFVLSNIDRANVGYAALQMNQDLASRLQSSGLEPASSSLDFSVRNSGQSRSRTRWRATLVQAQFFYQRRIVIYNPLLVFLGARSTCLSILAAGQSIRQALRILTKIGVICL